MSQKYVLQRFYSRLPKKFYSLATASLILCFQMPFYLSLMLILLGGYFLYPQFNAKFELYYTSTPENEERRRNCKSIAKGYFFPTLYLGYGYLQAFFGSHSRFFNKNLIFTRETIYVDNNGELALDWASLPEEDLKGIPDRSNSIIVIIPGLTATFEEPYVKNITAEALLNGYKVVIYNDRVVCPKFTFPEKGHVKFSDDLYNSLKLLKKRFPNHDLYMIGHSFGANIMFNHLGENKDDPIVKGSVSVANPFDLLLCSKYISRSVYEKYITRIRQKMVRSKYNCYKNAPAFLEVELDKALNTESTLVYDEYLSRRVYGYKTVNHYYRGISCAPKVLDISIPTLLIQSYDDPIIHRNAIPIDECILNSKLMLLITNTGGHVGWFEGFIQPKRWYPKPTIEYINQLVEENKRKK